MMYSNNRWCFSWADSWGAAHGSLIRKFFRGICLGLLCSCLGLTACIRQQQQILLSGDTMGTSYHITCLVPHNFELTQEQVGERIVEVLALVNHQMSAYDKNSVLSRLNRYQYIDQPLEITESLVQVLSEAMALNKLTQGGLDITLGPLVNLWGFGAQSFQTETPDDDAIAEAMARTGIDKINVFSKNGRHFFQKKEPELYLDLASIAKGFGVDKVAELLDSLNIKNFLVEIGGEIRTRGKNKQGVPWRVGIEKPDTKGQRSVEMVVPLVDLGMATSGDYRNYFQQDGKRFSHVIDPSTGYPIAHNMASITVVHPSAMIADGLATGLFVLGPDMALDIAEQNNLAVYLIIRTENEFQSMSSSAFTRLLAKNSE